MAVQKEDLGLIRTSLTADELLDEFGGKIIEPSVSAASINNPTLKAYYDAEPKVPVYIPEPPNWKEDAPYYERVEINGLIYHVQSEVMVNLPISVKAVLDNQRGQNRLVATLTKKFNKRMNYGNISEVPDFVA